MENSFFPSNHRTRCVQRDHEYHLVVNPLPWEFNLEQRTGDCHTNQLHATKGSKSDCSERLPWHLSLPAARVAPLFQRKAEQALTPATIPVLLPKPNHLSKERIFFLTGPENFKDSSNWIQRWYEGREWKEWSYLLSISVWYSYTGFVSSKLTDNEDREKEEIKNIDGSMCHYSQEITTYPSKMSSGPEYYVQHWSQGFKKSV